MNRKEALEDFKENVAKSLIDECKTKFQEGFKKNEKNVKKLIIDSIKSIIKKASNSQKIIKDYKIAIIQFEFLRINILNESYKIAIHGYNEFWYLDENSIIEDIDLKFIFEPFIKLKENLIQKKKIYTGKINNYDIEKIIFDSTLKCYRSITESARNWLWNLDEEEFMKESSIQDFYTIRWGEYQGKSEIIFAMDNREKSIKELLELKDKPKEKLPFVYGVWKNSNLQNADLTKENMLFINFKGSKLKNIDFSQSHIIRAQFSNMRIKECKFENSILVGTSFENSKLEDCNFQSADCSGANFTNSELSYIDFKNVNLKNANFINSKFMEVSFEDAELEEAIFSEEDIPFIHLTPEQLQKIYIYGGKEK